MCRNPPYARRNQSWELPQQGNPTVSHGGQQEIPRSWLSFNHFSILVVRCLEPPCLDYVSTMQLEGTISSHISGPDKVYHSRYGFHFRKETEASLECQRHLIRRDWEKGSERMEPSLRANSVERSDVFRSHHVLS